MTSKQAAIPRDWALRLIKSAILAPSSHNTQPWRFRLRDRTIDLLADRRRGLPANDPEDRELIISCACALFNLRVAAAAIGLLLRIHLLPRPEEPDLLASVEIGPPGAVAPSEAFLADALSRRCTCREAFAAKPPPDYVLATLTAAVEAEGAWLQVLAGDGPRQQAAALVAAADRRQWSDPGWRRELAAWLHSRRQGDGLALPALAAPLARFLVRSLDLGPGLGRRHRQLAEESPVLAVLGTAGDLPGDWLAAGQGLQHLLLQAAAQGLQAAFLNQPVQVAHLRPRLQELAGRNGYPQLLLQLGYPARPPRASPRRRLEEVVIPG